LSIQMSGTFQAFIDACFNFPSLAELYKYATYDAMKRHQQGRVRGCIVQLEPVRVAHESWPGGRVMPAAERALA
jgi:hypothetical protein